VTTTGIKYSGNVLKVRKYPSLGLFRNGQFLLHEGSLVKKFNTLLLYIYVCVCMCVCGVYVCVVCMSVCGVYVCVVCMCVCIYVCVREKKKEIEIEGE
jgi:hypothetical protein